MLSALVAGPNIGWGMLASVFVDLVRVAVAVALGAVPRQFTAAGAFTAVLWQEASSLEALAVLLSGPLLLLFWSGKRRSLKRLALISLALGLWRFFGGIK
ncbi:MAG: hypothetical protein GX766_07480 [Firmicutes bacterium]|nr:hypothetical protein [Bacillota bacterium]HOB21997.1 hypothetical protein [Bacillota bacterium]HQD40469.1 hypothetical protein [Bacillota bacterium]